MKKVFTFLLSLFLFIQSSILSFDNTSGVQLFPLHTLPETHTASSPSAWSPNGLFFAHASGRIIELYSPITNKELPANSTVCLVCSETSAISCLAFTADSKALAIVHKNGTLTWFNLQPQCQEIRSQKNALPWGTKSILCAPKGGCFVITTTKKRRSGKRVINFYEISFYLIRPDKSCQFLNTIDEPKYQESIQNMEFNQNTNELITTFLSGVILLSEAGSGSVGSEIQKYNLFKNTAQCLFATAHFAAPGMLLYALPKQDGTSNWTVITRKNTQKKLRTWGTVSGCALTQMAYSKILQAIAVSNEKGLISILRKNQKATQILTHPNNKKVAAADTSRQFAKLWFDNNQNLLYGASADKTLCAWDLKTNKCTVLATNVNPTNSVAIHDNSGTLAVCTQQGRKLIAVRHTPHTEKAPTL